MSKKRAFLLCAVTAIVALAVGALGTGIGILMWSPWGKLVRISRLVEATYYKPVDPAVLPEGAARGLLQSLGDPYSQYLSAAEWREFKVRSAGEYSGVGITIQEDKDGRVIVVSPMKGSPAEKAGVLPKDVIIEVDGVPVKSSDDAAVRIRGPQGTQVNITVLRGEEKITFTLTRAVIVVPAAEWRMVEPEIGYVKLMSFTERAYHDTAEAVQDLRAKGAKALILDLRDNGGGDLDQCVKVAGLFIPKGPVVTLKGRAYPPKTYQAEGEGLGIPLVVLVNDLTASASEILAGAIQDTKSGTIVGVTTFGKGVVQQLFPQPDGSCVKVTTFEYFTPAGRSIHEKGIVPDVVVENPEPGAEADKQMEKALELAREALRRPT